MCIQPQVTPAPKRAGANWCPTPGPCATFQWGCGIDLPLVASQHLSIAAPTCFPLTPRNFALDGWLIPSSAGISGTFKAGYPWQSRLTPIASDCSQDCTVDTVGSIEDRDKNEVLCVWLQVANDIGLHTWEDSQRFVWGSRTPKKCVILNISLEVLKSC